MWNKKIEPVVWMELLEMNSLFVYTINRVLPNGGFILERSKDTAWNCIQVTYSSDEMNSFIKGCKVFYDPRHKYHTEERVIYELIMEHKLQQLSNDVNNLHWLVETTKNNIKIMKILYYIYIVIVIMAIISAFV